MPTGLLAAGARMVGFDLPRHEPDKIRKYLAMAAGARNFDHIADGFVDEWYGQASPLMEPLMDQGENRALPYDVDPLTRITYRDAIAYLPDDILVKVDRAGMAVSLEGRIPFLDHRVAALAARIDPALKVEGGRGKAILRDLLARHIPRDIIERPKAGFGIPLGQWIKGPLRDWAEDLLDPRHLKEGGTFDVDVVRARWQAHLSGRRHSEAALWSVLMFEAWRRSARG